MSRYIVHLRNHGYTSKDARELLMRSRMVSNDQEIIIRDSRVSSKYLEFDITVEREKLDALLSSLAQLSPVANTTEIIDNKLGDEQALELATFLFNDERFWECHEVLEGVWKKKEKGEEKNLLQGIILTCAAFVHSQKNENDVCLNILERAITKLAHVPGNYCGIDLDGFKESVTVILNRKEIYYFKI